MRQTNRPVLARLSRLCQLRGAYGAITFLLSRIFRTWEASVYEARLGAIPAVQKWADGEEMLIIGPENVDTAINDKLYKFLGGGLAVENLESVRAGSRLFVISRDGQFVHHGYIFFNTRQTTILGEPNPVPLIGCCRTAPAARGAGYYRRALAAELAWLGQAGYQRVLIEAHPENRASQKGIEAARFTARRQVRSWIFLNFLLWQRIVQNGEVRWQLRALDSLWSKNSFEPRHSSEGE